MTTLTRTKELALSATGKKVLAIAGFVALELLIVYGLIPVGISLWRLLTCAC
jgi:hypothetical protein